jgi:predicted O-methyltransferase YrrM
MSSILNDPVLDALLPGLHAASEAQDEAIGRYYREERTGPWTGGMEARDHAFMADKAVALERDKAEFCYMICRAIGARRIFEAGTSFGVSTLYLAAAVRDNGGGVVFGAEYEPAKVKQARTNFEAAGLTSFIDLREGDIVEAAKTFEGPIDFVLFDIWGDMLRQLIEILAPRLRPGSVLCADNTAGAGGSYGPMFEYINNPANRLRTMTLPFKGGFELTVRV